MFTVEAFPAPELGNASFLVADRARGVALVIDPLRDVDPYLRRADSLGVKVTHALDTHLHNDYVSGRRELQDEVGTDIAELPPGEDLALGEVTRRATRLITSAICSRSGTVLVRCSPAAP